MDNCLMQFNTYFCRNCEKYDVCMKNLKIGDGMKNFYFTFGDDRLDKYVKITAKDEKEARKRMFLECGRQWCTSYCEEDFLPLIKERNMKQLFHFVCEE